MSTRRRYRIAGMAERGAALVELSLVLPILVLVMAAGTDFARVFYTANVLTNASRAGAQVCTETAATAATCVTTVPAIVQQITDANSFGTLAPAPTAVRVCECANEAGTTWTANDCTAACVGGHRVIHVTVTVARTQSMIFSGVPGIPATLTITRSAMLRAQ